MTRIIIIPLFLFLLIQNSTILRIMALIVFTIISLSDLLDGYIARKLNQTTEFGKFLDPVADKLLVISTLAVFILLDPLVPLYMVIAIFIRDLLITIIRVKAIKNGFSINTSKFAKWKTTFQFIVILIILMIFITRSYIKNAETTPEVSPIEQQILSSLQKASHYINSTTIKTPQNNITKRKLDFAHSIPYFLMLFITILTMFSLFHYLWLNRKIILKIFRLQSDKHK